MANEQYKNIIHRIKEWPLSRKLSLVAVLLLSLILFAIIIFQARNVKYQTLYAGLSTKKASSVVNWLKKHNVPYKIKNNGSAIYVPANKVYEIRLNLASAGLPKGNEVGFEIFDNQNFGITRFTQKVNYQRALQGELARTIASLGPVKSARVHLVLPEKRLLKEQQKKPKASVVLKLEKGESLDQSQINGIVYLVSGSVEGLKKSNVTVVNSQGQVLSNDQSSFKGGLSPQKIEYKVSLENKLEEKAQSLLNRVCGPGNSMVRVTAELNFVQQKKTEELYDPNSIVPRSEKTTKKVYGSKRMGGIPGAASNLGQSNSSVESVPSSEHTEIINYEISKTVNNVTKAMGSVKNISVAVLVAEKYLSDLYGQKKQKDFEALHDKKLQSIKSLVASALGLDIQRGDHIEVVSMPFEKAYLQKGTTSTSAPTQLTEYLSYIKYAMLFLAAILVYFFLLRPVIKTMRGEVKEQYKTVQELEEKYEDKISSKDLTEQLRQEIAESEVTPAQVIKTWLKEG